MEEETLKFLERHNISQKEIIDAEGLSISDLRDHMKANNILFAYNTTECDYGHTIRTRKGHCIVCNTHTIAFLRRYLVTGHIYIAGSISKQLIKVGMSTVPIDKRLSALNSRKVGNTNDWVVIKSVKCDQANEHEFNIHGLLKKYRVDGDKYGDHESREIFRCSYEKANSILEEYFELNKITQITSTNHVYNTEKYAFRNLVNSKNI
jgi:hypothetical protein